MRARRLAALAVKAGSLWPGPAWRGKGAARATATAQRGPPLEVQANANTGGGRGLFAARAVTANETVLASPLSGAFAVVHALPASARDVCWRCLRWLDGNGTHDGTPAYPKHGQENWCGLACRQSHAISDATDRGEAVTGATDELRTLCASDGAAFPLLALRLARAAIAGDAPKSLLDPLCHARLDTVPDSWREAHAIFEAALPPGEAAHFPLEWFVGVLARAHLNAFRVSMPRMNMDAASMAEALAADIAGDGKTDNGVAIYLHASFFNHSCDPTVEASWPNGSADVTFKSLRELLPGEEATVAYTDTTANVRVRRSHLLSNYGFSCACARCVAEASDTPS